MHVVRLASACDIDGLMHCDPRARSDPGRRALVARAADEGGCLVAELDGEPLGFLVLEYSFFGHGFIALVCVAERHRRRGIAERLMKAAEMHCRTPKLFTSTNVSNRRARALFEKVGFVPTGWVENLDEGDPELIYFKSVATP